MTIAMNLLALVSLAVLVTLAVCGGRSREYR